MVEFNLLPWRIDKAHYHKKRLIFFIVFLLILSMILSVIGHQKWQALQKNRELKKTLKLELQIELQKKTRPKVKNLSLFSSKHDEKEDDLVIGVIQQGSHQTQLFRTQNGAIKVKIIS